MPGLKIWSEKGRATDTHCDLNDEFSVDSAYSSLPGLGGIGCLPQDHTIILPVDFKGIPHAKS
jgi:hypothetical protein